MVGQVSDLPSEHLGVIDGRVEERPYLQTLNISLRPHTQAHLIP